MKRESLTEKLVYDHYYDYVELSGILKELASAYPFIARLESIGKTPGDRDIWLMEVTNFERGPSEDKPAVWIDGNTHAGEVTGSMICLKTIEYLLVNYGHEPSVTKLLDEKAFYIVPRIDVDGAEFALKTPYYVLGGDNETGGGRWYPLSEEKWKLEKGLYLEDINGDGFIVSMRIKDPDGGWKTSDKDGRIIVEREAGEEKGTFYRVFPEGLILNYDGDKHIKMAPPRWSMNFNRNYPGEWAKEETRKGTGPYPLSETETRAVANYIISHPNICLAVTYHTHGGVVFSHSEDETIPRQDRNLFKIVGSLFEKVTGYPALSLKSRGGPGGSFSSYLTLHRGIPCVTVEVWDILGRAGLGNFVERGGFGPRPSGNREEQQMKLLEWNDRELEGDAFIDWIEFDHPQLGKVEIGGWKKKFLTRNPPEKFLEREIDKVMYFPIRCAELLPKLTITNSDIQRTSGKIHKVKVTVSNNGALPTYVMKHAKDIGSTGNVEVTLELDEKMRLIKGNKFDKVDLEGYLYKQIAASRREREIIGIKSNKTLTWIVEVSKPGKITIQLSSYRAGKYRTILNIPT